MAGMRMGEKKSVSGIWTVMRFSVRVRACSKSWVWRAVWIWSLRSGASSMVMAGADSGSSEVPKISSKREGSEPDGFVSGRMATSSGWAKISAGISEIGSSTSV